LEPLKEAISCLSSASIALDKEKVKAEKTFRRMLRKLRKGSVFSRFRRWISRVMSRVGGTTSDSAPHIATPQFVPKKFIKAAKHVQAVNKKLSSFERGFISSEGIKDREW
jgi:N-acetylated-alpha-linked acidic dipeptidase